MTALGTVSVRSRPDKRLGIASLILVFSVVLHVIDEARSGFFYRGFWAASSAASARLLASSSSERAWASSGSWRRKLVKN